MIQKDLTEAINKKYPEMSKGQKKIAEYILHNYDKAAYLTAVKLGQAVKVSESTIVRFAYMLGYDGYPLLQEALQDILRSKLTAVQRAEIASGMEIKSVLKNTLKADIENIRLTIEEADGEIFEKGIESLINARSVYIIGLRSALPLVQFMGYYFSFILDNVKLVTSGVNDIFEQLIQINKDDILIAVSFPRYSKRTIEAITFSKEKGATILAITDSVRSPLAKVATYSLIARSDMASFADSLVAPLSLINALIIAVANHKRKEVAAKFSELEVIWEKFNVYVGKDSNEF